MNPSTRMRHPIGRPVPSDVRAAFGDFRPTVLVFRNRMAVVYRAPEGYCFQTFSIDDGEQSTSGGPYVKHAMAAKAAVSELEYQHG